ncbi:MAG: hypothetical protein ABI867_22215, partial [Kofleriaceae bacterium]
MQQLSDRGALYCVVLLELAPQQRQDQVELAAHRDAGPELARQPDARIEVTADLFVLRQESRADLLRGHTEGLLQAPRHLRSPQRSHH